MKTLSKPNPWRPPVLGALAVFAVMAQAQTPAATAAAPCKGNASAEQANACALQNFQAVDEEITTLYRDVSRALSAHERPDLWREQSAWKRERDARCQQATRTTSAQPEGPRLQNECLTGETQARRKGLMHWLTLDHPSANP